MGEVVSTLVGDTLKRKRDSLLAQLGALRVRQKSGDYKQLLVWVIPDELAIVPRPLRYHQQYGCSGFVIPASAKSLIEDWVLEMQVERVNSIISFMHERDLGCYADIDLDGRDFSGFLETHGFTVCRLPWEDPRRSKTEPAAKREKCEQMVRAALQAYDQLPKPVVLMCSAGVDRSTPAAVYIWANRSQ